MKIFKLFINENIKTRKKISTKILILVVILSLFGVLGIVKIMKSATEIVTTDEFLYGGYESKEDYLKQQIEYYEEQSKNEKYDEETRQYYIEELERYKLYLEYDIDIYDNSTWKSLIIDEIVEQKLNGKNVDSLITLLKNDDFSGYMNIQKVELKEKYDKKSISEQEYNDELKILELKEKYEIGKNADDSNDWKRYIISDIRSYQRSIRTGINQETNKLLKTEEKQEIENKMKIALYRLENNIPDSSNGSEVNYRMRYELLAPIFSIAVISIMAIVMAGGTISTEVSSGTIKFWALTPNKRWKILTAKLLSILFYIIIITFITSLLSIAISNIYFEEEGTTYLYVKNNQVEQINNTLYTIEYYFAKTIPVIIFAMFAVMLSTLTRNTAVAVSISVALYAGNGIGMQIINSFIKKDWIRYVPFNNLNIVDKIFSNETNILSSSSSFATSTTLGFSLGVLGVCAILMLVTMYDSFNKRDII